MSFLICPDRGRIGSLRLSYLSAYFQKKVPKSAMQICRWAAESELGDRCCIVGWGVLVNIEGGSAVCDVELPNPQSN